jgi:hypothetical protein
MSLVLLAREEDRLLIEIADLYQEWVEASRRLHGGRYRWKTVTGTQYLTLIKHGQSNGQSMGARSAKTEKIYENSLTDEQTVKAVWPRMALKGRMLKVARVPMVTDVAGDALRALDVAGLLGSHIRVVGSTALPAYEIAAGVKLDPSLHATEDADITWVGPSLPEKLWTPILDALKRSDGTWTVNTERQFQLRNRNGDILDVLVAPSVESTYPSKESIHAISTPGQEDILGGIPLDRVVIDAAGLPVRIVAPDPRLFALHKLKLSIEPGRRIEKRTKDQLQGMAVFSLVADRMPEYPFGDDFVATLSPSMRKVFEQTISASKEHAIARPRLPAH